MVGRDRVLEEFREALDDGPGASGRATLYTGARGAGETVLLNAVEDLAKQSGWLVVSETATAGFVNRIVGQHLPRPLRQLDPEAVRRRLTSLTGPLSLGAASWDSVEAHVVKAGLRNQIELLTDGGWERLTSQEFRVSPSSNRIGLRLEGPTEVRLRDTRELPSEGIVTGAVLLPPGGQPVVFLADHPATGGYPVVAVVEPDDLAACAQARPGAHVRLVT